MLKLGTLIENEVRKALPALLLFFLAFHMIAITKTVILEDYAVNVAGSAVATVGALIVAKAILIVEKLPLARLFSGRAAYNILWRALVFGAVAMSLDALQPVHHAFMVCPAANLMAGALA